MAGRAPSWRCSRSRRSWHPPFTSSPSLPGYGFSDPPSSAGMSNARMAELFAQLMTTLGYERFGAQGGDWGAGIATWLAAKFPSRLVGIHLNYIPGSYAPAVEAPLSP